MGHHLHLDVELPSLLVARLHIEDRELVVKRVLVGERIEDLDLGQTLRRRSIQDRLDQVDQYVRVALVAEQVFEREIDLGVNAELHASGGLLGWDCSQGEALPS